MEDYEKGFAYLGFKIKLQLVNNPLGVDFLKGAFYRTVSGRMVWSHLPSRLLKAGKSVKDVRLTQRRPGERNISLYTACERQVASVANSYKVFPQVPILQKFVSKFQNDDPFCKMHWEAWRIQGSSDGVQLDAGYAYELIAYRYGVTVHDILELEQMVEQWELFSQIWHPLFDRFALVDYGPVPPGR